MFRDKRFIAAIFVALAVVVILDVRYFMNRSKGRTSSIKPHAQAQPLSPVRAVTKSPSTQHTAAQPAKLAAVSPSQQVAKWREAYPLKAGSRNPFQAIGTQHQAKSSRQSTEEMEDGSTTRLGAIAMVDGKMLALIDGEPVEKNGSLGNMKVVYIGPDGVTLREGGDRWAESLPPLPADAVNVVRQQ